MFEQLKDQPADKILALMQAFREDKRADKIDLGVGVYRNAEGQTPIMRAVKAAERRWWDEEDTKAYTGLAGDPGFSDAMIRLILGPDRDHGTVAAVATPGGTGAVRQGFDLVRLANPRVRVFVSDPTWPNHLSILKHMQIEMVPYRYFDENTGGVDFDGMQSDLAKAGTGDVVLLHGCCHNPTGANLKSTEWEEVIALLNKTGATPMIDLAYQGFGDGLEADAAATRSVAERCPETIIAASCSKNFGIYSERTGLLLVTSHDKNKRATTQGSLAFLNRQNYSFPPDHGARLVTLVLNDPELRADWEAELEDVRSGMLNLRSGLAAELRKHSGSDRFGFIGQHRGMFSRLGLAPDQIERLRKEHAIYMVGDSRINIAGLNESTVPVLAKAIIEVGG
ncbi:MAG: amino acid aminotransferase [Pseudomonadota bacterium]